jgi:hypothetical protein
MTTLSEHPSSDVITRFIWGGIATDKNLSNGEPATELHQDAYFDYYQQQWGYFGQQGSICVDRFTDLEPVIQQLKKGSTREDIIGDLKQRYPITTTGFPEYAKNVFDNTVNFASRLILMMEVGELEHEVFVRRQLSWTEGSLGDFVANRFSSNSQRGYEKVRLPKTFDAWSIHNVGGIKIELTDNLADHLRLVEDDTKVYIFHHASILEYQILR